jgi:hypothetical protein
LRRSLEMGLGGRVMSCGLLAVFGCGDEPGLAPSPVGEGVERDGWVDAASFVSGDGATEFVSGTPSTVARQQFHGSPSDLVRGPYETEPAPLVVDGQRVYGLSSYAGLVITAAASPGLSPLEGRFPLEGSPFSISEAGGIVLALVNEYPGFVCEGGTVCEGGQGHVALIDARVPSSPTLLAERRVPGTITHAQRVGDALYLVSRELVPCPPSENCSGVSERSAVVTAIGLGDPLAFADQGQLSLPLPEGAAGVVRSFLFDGARLFVASGENDVRVVELDGLRLGPSAPLPGYVEDYPQTELALEAGILRARLWEAAGSPAQVQYRVTPTELVPIDPIAYLDPDGVEVTRLVFRDGMASGIGNGGGTLVTFDLTEREAPRAVGSVALPFAATSLYPTRDGELVALGGSDAGAPDEAIHVALLDVRDVSAPTLLDEVSWGSGTGLAREAPVYDPASELLLVPDGLVEIARVVQVVDTRGGELALANRFPFIGGSLAVGGDRVVQMQQNSVRTYPAFSGDTTRFTFTRPADAILRIGGQLALFENSGVDARLLPAQSADPYQVLVSGPSLNDVLLPAATGVWLPRALERDGIAYFARQPSAAGGELGIYGVDLSDPAAPLPAGSVVMAPALAVIPTQNGMLVARGELGVADNEPREAGQPVSPGRDLRFDVVDVTAPGAPRVAGSVELPAAAARGGFGDSPIDVTVDTAWGWQTGSRGAPLLVSGELVVSDHAEAIDVRHRRFWLDRIDVSQPDAPAVLPRINIPGEAIAFDAATGSLMTLEMLTFEERATPAACLARGYVSFLQSYEKSICRVTRHVLNGLTLDGDRAVRHSQLLLDDSRRSVAFAVTGDRAYYLTEPLLDDEQLAAFSSAALARGAAAGMPFSVERVRMDRGQLERLPSIDVTGLHDTLPRAWRVYARGDRLFTLSESELGIIDASVEPPSVRKVALTPYVCVAFEAVGNKGYCSRGMAGVVEIDLGE